MVRCGITLMEVFGILQRLTMEQRVITILQ